MDQDRTGYSGIPRPRSTLGRREFVRRVGTACGLLALNCWAVCDSADAVDIPIDLYATGERKLRIAVPEFYAEGAEAEDFATKLIEVLRFDLNFSGYFQLLSPLLYPVGFKGLPPEPNMVDYAAWGKQVRELLYGNCRSEGEGRFVVAVRLIDLSGPKIRQLLGLRYRVEKQQHRLLAHELADRIVKIHTGEVGIARTKLVFCSTLPGAKELYIMDYDGANLRRITYDKAIALSPSWHPDGGSILYTSNIDKNWDLYSLELHTGNRQRLAAYPGLNLSAVWSPRRAEISLTLSRDGNPEIYLLRPNGKILRRLTRNKVIDGEPSFSPTGEDIAFASDMAGLSQIYAVGRDGRNLRRLTYQPGQCLSPAWSPRGDLIAYVASTGRGAFDIFVMNADGSEPRRLTAGAGKNEDPCWSPDGRHIAFSSDRDGYYGIWVMNSDGSEQRKLVELGPCNCTSPAWSPRPPLRR